MARGKKSGGGGLGVILLAGLALLAAVPKEVWIVIGLAAIAAVAFYFYSKAKKESAARSEETNVSAYQRTAAPATARNRSQFRQSSPRDEPVSVGRATGSSNYRLPSAPAGYGEARWIPAGESVQVAGLTLPGGMLYVGTSLPTPSGANDPCLIDPSKNVATQGDYTERQFGYWPSYSEIPASARRAYLKWLADGRRDPEADIGFVFLFFYGLERRAIIDASKDKQAESDWPLIAKELRRLLAIYGEKSNSFRRYAGDLLSWAELATYPEKLYLRPVPEYSRTWELPLYLRLALGQAAVDAMPVPTHLALAWARLEPNTYLRTPATRCAEEFTKLFELKYAEACGSGLVLPRNKTKLKLVYRPASSGFYGYDEIKLGFGDTPDVTVLTAPVKKLQEIVEAATKELDAYSRYVGRNPTGAASLDGLLQLPATLWPESVRKVMRDLQARMDKGLVVFRFQELLLMLGAQGVLPKDKAVGLARALESMNMAMEPDILGGAKTPKPEDTVVLFSVQPGEAVNRSTPAYQAAVLTLQLASAVAIADGDMAAEEMRQLRTQIEGWSHLTPSHQQRLRAHLRLLVAAPVSLTALKKKLEPLDVASKEIMAKFMAVIAQSDGTVSLTELKMLEKVYKALGVEPNKVFSDVHAVAAETVTPTAVTPTKAAKPAAASGFQLDPARIAALQKDTEKVSALLANIFKEEFPEPTSALAPEPEEVEEPPHGLLGLDEVHTSFVRLLLSRPEWRREELLDVAADLDLMLDGALERVNEASFEAHDVALTEGDDPVTVNKDVLEKVEA